jgi:hypothetical protein
MIKLQKTTVDECHATIICDIYDKYNTNIVLDIICIFDEAFYGLLEFAGVHSRNLRNND